MGEVYCARDTRLERPVAIKILPLHLTDRLEAARAFRTRSARRLVSQSPSHLPTLRAGEQNGVSYLVMEMLEGETLAFGCSDRLWIDHRADVGHKLDSRFQQMSGWKNLLVAGGNP